MQIPNLIEKKRDGHELTAEEIGHIISGFTLGRIPDSQMSAWAMAVFFQGMTPAETKHLTTAIMQSGSVLEYGKGSPKRVDKYSSGGVGDKTSLVLAPLLACDRLWVPMICARDHGIAGNVLDKLESIPGFNVQIEERRALAQLESIGLFIIEEGESLCPADRKLYDLHNATGILSSQPLMVASVLSRKLAENLNRLLLDVKFGRGAFMKTRAEARKLAAAITKVGKLMGVKVAHMLTRTDEPLGRTVGPALEIAECVEILQGGGPADVVDLVLDQAELVSRASRAKLAGWLADGTAWRKFISMVYAQDGDASSLERITDIHRAPVIQPLFAERAGTVRTLDADILGRAALQLGAGRQTPGSDVDFAVGFSRLKKEGEKVEAKEPLLLIHARSQQQVRTVVPMLESAIEIA